MIKVAFFGTNNESIPALNVLLGSSDISVVLGVTSAPKRGDRNQMKECPVHIILKKQGIPVVFVADSNANEMIRKLGVDINVVVSYGKILSKDSINSARIGTINVHPSLLPKFRGPTPVPAAIMSGEDETGVTIIDMDEKMDHGPIIDSVKVPLKGNEKMPDLLISLMKIGADRLVNVIKEYVSGEIKKTAQDHAKATFTKLFTRDSGRIIAGFDSVLFERMVRALNPWPGVWMMVEQKGKPCKLKILEAHLDNYKEQENSSIIESDKILRIGRLILDRILFEGKKSVSGAEFAATHRRFSAKIL